MAKARKAEDHTQHSARRAGRLAAVQALYQLDMNDVAPAVVIAEFVGHRLEQHADQPCSPIWSARSRRASSRSTT
jgi:transcription termination factor NusB